METSVKLDKLENAIKALLDIFRASTGDQHVSDLLCTSLEGLNRTRHLLNRREMKDVSLLSE